MKKITFLIILCCGFIISAQEYQIQIRLVDAEVGYPTGDPIGNGYEPVSNDAELNTIFQNHNATNYFPGYDFIPEWQARTHFVLCNGCDINQFEQDLLNYDAVIAATFQCEPYYVANNLYVKLLDVFNGNPTGEVTPNGNIITTNAELNLLFEEHNVVYYEPHLGLTFYGLGCNCDATELFNELNILTDVVEFSERVGYVILNTPSSTKLDFHFYPNPVGDRMTINSSEEIISYEIISPLGQSIFKGNSEFGINELLPSLTPGTYYLRVNTDSGKMQSFRFIKK